MERGEIGMGGEAEESALGMNPFRVLLAGTLCIVSGWLLGVVLISAWPLRGGPYLGRANSMTRAKGDMEL